MGGLGPVESESDGTLTTGCRHLAWVPRLGTVAMTKQRSVFITDRCFDPIKSQAHRVEDGGVVARAPSTRSNPGAADAIAASGKIPSRFALFQLESA